VQDVRGAKAVSIRLTKEWLAQEVAADHLAGTLGVYQIANEQQDVVFIGYAGGKSRFGLKGEVAEAFQRLSEAAFVRWEVNTAYMSRYKELLMIHVHDNGQLPLVKQPLALGQLRPAG